MSTRPARDSASRRERLPAEERRRAIVAAATRLFRTGHYADVSLDMVAKEAGVTRGLINHHFGTKRGLYIEVLRSALDANILLIPDYVHGQSLAERLAFAVHGWVDRVGRNRELYLDSVRPQAGGDADVLAVIEESRANAAARFAAVIGLRPIDELAPAEVAVLRVTGAAAESALVQWLEHDRLDQEATEELVLDIVSWAVTRLLGASALS